MPTGYTAKIVDDISFDEFVLDCARAFGACITMRDESGSAEIPDSFQPSDYNKRQWAVLTEQLDELSNTSSSQAAINASNAYEEQVVAHKKRIKEKEELRDKYTKMLSRASAWEPPTDEHQGLKDFMIQQISQSIDFDCDTAYDSNHEPVKMSGKAWLESRIDAVNDQIKYHEKQDAEEVERANSRTKWVQDLRASLALTERELT